ncbi:MAG: hypothetical protein QM666_05640, partial [Acinetobacter sp.]
MFPTTLSDLRQRSSKYKAILFTTIFLMVSTYTVQNLLQTFPHLNQWKGISFIRHTRCEVKTPLLADDNQPQATAEQAIELDNTPDPAHTILHEDSINYAPIFDPQSPELAKQLMAVFGEDSLAARAAKSPQNQKPKRKFGFSRTAKANKNKKENKSSWVDNVKEDLSKILPFQNDVNLGSNSSSDVYVQYSAEKGWHLSPDFSVKAVQTFRYGALSKNYSETHFNFTQKQSGQAFTSSELSVVKALDEQYYWNNYLYRQQKFQNDRRLTYGIYSSGIYDK